MMFAAFKVPPEVACACLLEASHACDTEHVVQLVVVFAVQQRQDAEPSVEYAWFAACSPLYYISSSFDVVGTASALRKTGP